VQHLSSQAGQKSSIDLHIPSQYTAEMATKSAVVSDWILWLLYHILFCDLCMQVPLGMMYEICLTMKDLHKYVPMQTSQVIYHLTMKIKYVVNKAITVYYLVEIS